ncbi:hypothetical protein E2C01_007449 [Portunus trituberculatus]|uniref:Uncharacterized protein n=1 Tax=Portunus trituberculatus TaxID=210409 RepID=A0A5B7CZH1_PORTR|nr:hypothetical protein [Portunus trituberculatus]
MHPITNRTKSPKTPPFYSQNGTVLIWPCLPPAVTASPSRQPVPLLHTLNTKHCKPSPPLTAAAIPNN